MSQSYILAIACPDRPGIVHRVTGVIFDHGGNITDSRQFDDRETGRFFLRIMFDADTDRAPVAAAIAALAQEFAMDWKLVPADARMRVLVLVSKFDHCLSYLLYKVRMGELPMDIVAIASNHPASDALRTASIADIPFHHLPVTPATKAEQEARILALSWPVICRSCRTIWPVACPAGASTSTTASCPASRAPGPIIRRMRAA